jgi:hypothetical protein
MTLDEQAFRDRARELALSQVSLLITELQGFNSGDPCFAPLALNELRTDLARTLRTFIEQASIQPALPGVLALMQGIEHDPKIRTSLVNAERARLEKAGL